MVELKESRLILLLGGARAGKSSYAVNLAQTAATSDASVCCIATAEPSDAEMSERIAIEQKARPSQWRTIEEPYQLVDALRQTGQVSVVIVDCLTLFVSNWL